LNNLQTGLILFNEEIPMEAIEFGTSAVEGVIEIPNEYRKDFSTGLRVILIKDASEANFTAPKKHNTDIQARLAAAERLVGIASKQTLSLDEIRAERLARQ
jgi:hypothetical protein